MSGDLQYLVQVLVDLLIANCPREYNEATLTSRGVYEDAIIEITYSDVAGNIVIAENVSDQVMYDFMIVVSAIHDDMGEESGKYWSEFKFNLRDGKFEIELSYD